MRRAAPTALGKPRPLVSIAPPRVGRRPAALRCSRSYAAVTPQSKLVMPSTAGHACADSAKSAMTRGLSAVQSALAEKAAVRDPTADLRQQLSQASGVDRF